MLTIGKFHPAKEWTLKDIIEHRSEVPKNWQGYYVAKQTENEVKIYWYKNLTKKAKVNSLAIKKNELIQRGKV